ncbi:hypothetical protein OUZ56_014692 [Daphnia magna]|uniref:Hydroxyacylglutathione hydrolase C-terminal domain-containing protein n=1 Tax=Daphnia magna TaxID=35525 RepID=A0ABR0AKJ1_9CRUS|nr:hypothetical protein OUZ56_014692 [Daphnia magna]
MAPTPPPRQGGGGLSCSTFGLHVEPDNESVAKPISWTKEQRAKSEPIVPSLLSEEKLFNPFMRDNELTITAVASEKIQIMEPERVPPVREYRHGYRSSDEGHKKHWRWQVEI